MSARAEGSVGEEIGDASRVTDVRASLFGRPMWPQVYNDFVRAVDRAAWVRERLALADFDPVGRRRDAGRCGV